MTKDPTSAATTVRMSRAVFKVFFDFFLGKVQAVLVVSPDPVLVGQRFKAFLRAEAVVCLVLCNELFSPLLEYSHTLALNIRSYIAGLVGTLVPKKSRFGKGFVYYVYRAFYLSALVGVFDAKNERSVVVLSGKKCVKSGSEVADVLQMIQY